MSLQDYGTLLEILKNRFEKNKHRHPELSWSFVLARIERRENNLRTLQRMEETGGEPDVVFYDQQNDELIYCDCSAESPKGRRSLCYDRIALDARKENKPVGNVVDMAAEMGVELLNETHYRGLQEIEPFDTKTSSWVQTPQKIREMGGALFCDRRYDTVFVYHNGAESYYSSRGFRGVLKI